jgi:quercetin dioxygenase-like cupin family protein
MSTPQKLSDYPVHLGLGATCTVQPEFTGTEDWYAAYGQRTEGDDAEGRLVSSFTFTSSWTTWEMHPHGAEMVLCIAGTVTLIQEGRATAAATTTDDHETTTAAAEVTTKVQLNPGEFIINPPGVWHTADVEEGQETTVVFITAGKDTQIKPRC